MNEKKIEENNQVFTVSSTEIYEQIESKPAISIGAIIILNNKQDILFTTSKNDNISRYLSDVDFERARNMSGVTREIMRFFDDGTIIIWDYINNSLTLAIIFFPDNSLFGETIDYFQDTLKKLKALLS